MSLAQYRSKRDLRSSHDPEGNRSTEGQLRFVIQKHAASRLHYDFRLELDGVLKSWAIPKGPSLDPSDRRLAVMVEDHPLDYLGFEGTLPEGSYGAGTVMVWDQGTYSDYERAANRSAAVENLRRGLENGEIRFILNGKKLRGAFVLVKMRPKQGNNYWLLIKKRDEFADDEDPLNDDISVVSGRSFEEIMAAKNFRSNKPTLDLEGATKARQPKFLEPMLATLVDDGHYDLNWITEVKWDGYRILAFVENGNVHLKSRNGKDYTSVFQQIADELKQVSLDCVLDGEVVVLDKEGISDFGALQNYQRTGDGDLRYYVFDLPFADGYDLTNLPLLRRKEALRALVEGLDYVKFSDYVAGKAKEMLQQAKARNLEGIVVKDASSKYEPGKRTKSWLKIKTRKRQEAVIGGYTAPRGGRDKLGALVLGVYDNGELTYIGHTGGGSGNRQLNELYDRLHPLELRSSPFSTSFKTNAPVTWVEPVLICEVEFEEWTSDGLMRQPSFIGLREDKDPRLVRREESQSKPEAVVERPSRIRRSRVRFTHLDGIYWPDEGYTKRDLVAYYDVVAELILPYLRNRPESLNRQPNGIGEPGFFQKDVENSPVWAKTVPIHSESGDRDINWLVCDNRDTLLYMANLGCIEVNPWLSRLSSLDKPDFCLVDLDAKACPFDSVITVALETKKLLNELGVPSYPKTSGKTGMHICIPLNSKYSYDQSRQFAELVVGMIHDRLPRLTSIERDPSKRRNQIYLDYLQNRRGQTMAAPYCVRPVPGAHVSTPLSWEEVDRKLRPQSFTIKTVVDRFESLGDLWKPVLAKGIDMRTVLKESGRPDGR